MSTHRTTRRTVLAGAASVPIAARAGTMTGASTSSSSDQRLLDIEAKVRELLPHMEAAGRLHTESEERMFEWCRLNPAPKMRETEDDAGSRAVFRQLSEGKKGKQIKWPVLSADQKAAKRAHEAAYAEWMIRHDAAVKECRLEERRAAFEDKALCQIDDLSGEAAEIRAATLEGIHCKARLIELDACDPDLLAMSIVDDLLAWQGRA